MEAEQDVKRGLLIAPTDQDMLALQVGGCGWVGECWRVCVCMCVCACVVCVCVCAGVCVCVCVCVCAEEQKGEAVGQVVNLLSLSFLRL